MGIVFTDQPLFESDSPTFAGLTIGDLVIDDSQSLGVGQDGYSMTWDATAGKAVFADVSGGGGNPFDQDLNTTDVVEFNSVTLPTNGNISTNAMTFNGSRNVYWNLTSSAYSSFPSDWGLGWNSGTNGSAAGNDTILYRDDAGVLALRNGVNAQSFNIYNTYTDDSNYERLRQYWDSNVAVLKVEADGTGIERDFHIGTDGGGAVDFAESGSIQWSVAGVGGSAKMTLNNSRLEMYADIDPDASGTRILGNTDRWARINLGGNTVTADAPPIDIDQTYNDAGVDFKTIYLDLTNSASNSLKPLQIDVGGTEVFNIDSLGGWESYGSNDGAGNFERLRMYWSGGVAIIDADNGGSGSNDTLDIFTSGSRNIRFDNNLTKLYTNLRFNGSSLDIGESPTNSSPRSVYAHSSISIGNSSTKGQIRSYNSYTDASNGEYFEQVWAGNVCIVRTDSNGTGIDRIMRIHAGSDLELRSGPGDEIRFYINTSECGNFDSGGDLNLINGLGLHGVSAPAQSAHIADVSSGTDAAYETAINAIIAVLEAHGLTALS